VRQYAVTLDVIEDLARGDEWVIPPSGRFRQGGDQVEILAAAVPSAMLLRSRP